MAHLTDSKAVHVACAAAIALLVGGGFASPAWAEWQPRAAVATQALKPTPAGDWKPRHSLAAPALIRAATEAGSAWAPRSSLGRDMPTLLLAGETSSGWTPRGTVPAAARQPKAVSADWKPRAGMTPEAGTVGILSRKRQDMAPAATAETVATLSITN
jgi:hypothetical protein